MIWCGYAVAHEMHGWLCAREFQMATCTKSVRAQDQSILKICPSDPSSITSWWLLALQCLGRQAVPPCGFTHGYSLLRWQLLLRAITVVVAVVVVVVVVVGCLPWLLSSYANPIPLAVVCS